MAKKVFVIKEKILVEYNGKFPKVTIPEGVIGIDARVFSRNEYLRRVVLPGSIQKIGYDAFEGCSNLESINLPEEPIELDGGAFYGCRKLADEAGFVAVYDTLFDYCGEEPHVTVPENIKHISAGAFFTNSLIESVTLPDGLLSIGDEAFNMCFNLREINFPEGLEYIGDKAFEDCEELRTVVLPKSLRHIGREAFINCSSIKNLSMPGEISEVGEEVFQCCHGLRDENGMVIVNGVLYSYYVEETGKRKKKKLLDLVIPDTVKHISSSVFDYHDEIGTVSFPAGLLSVGRYAFAGCKNLKEVTLPQGTTEIGMWAFVNCHSLQQVTLPDSIETIGFEAFSEIGDAEIIACERVKELVRRSETERPW